MMFTILGLILSTINLSEAEGEQDAQEKGKKKK